MLRDQEAERACSSYRRGGCTIRAEARFRSDKFCRESDSFPFCFLLFGCISCSGRKQKIPAPNAGTGKPAVPPCLMSVDPTSSHVYFIHSFCNGNTRLGYSRSRNFTSPSKAHSQALSHRDHTTRGSLNGIETYYSSFSSV